MKAKLKYNRKSYTAADYYISYKQYIEADTVYDIDYYVFKAIITDYFKYIKDEVIGNSKEFKLPCRLGSLQIIKHQPKEYSSKSLRWDCKATKELDKPIFLLNEHSNGWKYRFYWSKKDCLLTNKSKYQFIASRQNKRDLAQIIINHEKDFIEL